MFALPLWAKIAGPLVVVLLLFGALKLYGHHQYNLGVSAENGRWQKASHKLEQQAANSMQQADVNAVVAVTNHDHAVQQEKEKLDAAEQTGNSAIDVLFGS